ncbi:MAG TPA: hypothetical protein PLK12_17410 [Prolixibacteraceae bacterium]|nr:hypothetical protein [Prolixibacteraceae bacterium]
MGSFFYTPKPKQFHVEPRYWDPKKEEREARERRIKAEMGIREEGESYHPNLRKGDFRKSLANTKWAPHIQRRRSNTRFLILLAILALLLYLMLK